MKPEATKTWLFMPVMLDPETGEIVSAKRREEAAPSRKIEDADKVISISDEHVVGWLGENPERKQTMWEAFKEANPVSDGQVPPRESKEHEAWLAERKAAFCQWTASRYGQDIQAWAMAKQQAPAEEPEKKLRLAFAMSRVIVDLHAMTTGPEVAAPQVNPARVLQLLARYAKDDGAKIVEPEEATEGNLNEIPWTSRSRPMCRRYR